MEKGKECIIPNRVIGKCSICGKELKGLFCDECGPLAFAAQVNGPSVTVKVNGLENKEQIEKMAKQITDEITKSMKNRNRL